MRGAEGRRYRLQFEGVVSLEKLQAWLESRGYTCEARVNEKKGIYELTIEGHGKIDVRRLFEAPAAAARPQRLLARR